MSPILYVRLHIPLYVHLSACVYVCLCVLVGMDVHWEARTQCQATSSIASHLMLFKSYFILNYVSVSTVLSLYVGSPACSRDPLISASLVLDYRHI